MWKEILLQVAKILLGLGHVPTKKDLEELVIMVVKTQLAKIEDERAKIAAEAKLTTDLQALFDQVGKVLDAFKPTGDVPDLNLDIEIVSPSDPPEPDAA